MAHKLLPRKRKKEGTWQQEPAQIKDLLCLQERKFGGYFYIPQKKKRTFSSKIKWPIYSSVFFSKKVLKSAKSFISSRKKRWETKNVLTNPSSQKKKRKNLFFFVRPEKRETGSPSTTDQTQYGSASFSLIPLLFKGCADGY